jgi:cytochrome c-type biogenesis protein CcmH
VIPGVSGRCGIGELFAIATLLAAMAAGLPAQAALAETNAARSPSSQPGAPAEGTVEPRANLPDLEDEVMCPICGTLLGLSRAPAAERQRVFMRRLIAEGKTGQEIKDALVAEYGPQVLALPDDEDTNFFVYVVPLAGLILGALAVLWAAIRWRRNRGEGPASDRDDIRPGPSETDSSRLDQDLAEYDS